MAENFNVQPYWDDWDPTKNYLRVLFKPGFAVQARELTQSQSILQNQISNFASNIFTQNTPVSGGKVTTNLNVFYLKLQTQYAGVNITAASFLNKIVIDPTGTIVAKVIATAEANAAGDPPTLILSYMSGIHFGDATNIIPTDGTNITATTIGTSGGSTCTGPSSVASISQGVFYIVNGYSTSSTQNADGTYNNYTSGYFVTVSPQTVILDKYDNNPSLRVGLEINETVVDYVNDVSLLDPALNSSNYQAPGADRYQITLDLITMPLTIGNDSQFIELVRLQSGSIIKQVDGTVYSVIDDYFAKRDYETNGDYIVYDFKVTPSANAASNTQYNLTIGKGVAYVRGYRVENQSDLVLVNNRARTTASVPSNAVYVDYGNYFYVCNVAGTMDGTQMPSVDIHCTQYGNVVTTNTTTYSSTKIGTAFLRDLVYVTDYGNSQTNAYVYKAYVSDFSANVLSGNASSATSNTITFYDTNGTFSSVANAYYGVTVAITGGTDAGDIRNIVNYNGATKTITVDKYFTVTPDSTSIFALQFQSYDAEAVIRPTSTGYGIANSANLSVLGKVNGIPMGDAILQNPGSTQPIFQVGYPYIASLANTQYSSVKTYRNQSISAGSLTLSAPGSLEFLGNGTLAPSVAKQNFIVIDKSTNLILDFASSGNTINIATGGTTATLTSATYSGKTVDVIATMFVSSGDNTTDGGVVLKAKNLVVGNTSAVTITSSNTQIGNTYIDSSTQSQVLILQGGISTNTRMSLYVNDVKRITKIIDTKNTGLTTAAQITPLMASSAYDVTNHFQLDNGQRDNFYDHAGITLLPGAPKPIGNILVVFDHYAHAGGGGYFSAMSYQSPESSAPENYASINSYTASDGTVYYLRDCIDFRPCRQNAQALYVWEGTNVLLPNDLSTFNNSYNYYLGRDDQLVITKDQNFLIIPGTPSNNPTFPSVPDGALVLAQLKHDPYTAYVPGEAPSGITPNLNVTKIPHKRWAKSDITNLQSTVNNLEYYTALSLLEQNAQSLQIPDVNGLNRFKNGILVDDFSSYAAADTTNSDFASNINMRQKRLGPLTVVNNFQLQNPVVLASLGTLANTATYAMSTISGTQSNYFTLPYTTANVVVQGLASDAISVNPFSVIIQQGLAQLNPPMDNWVDPQTAPSVLVNDPTMQIYQQPAGINLTNAGDFATLIGTAAASTAAAGSTSQIAGITQAITGTVTQTYASQVQSVSSATTNPSSTTFATNNGYLTNIAVLPYIRPQQIIVQEKGMLVNTPINAWFDGVNVNAFITTPNTIELSNVSGTFNPDDIVGFYSSSVFYPVARVINLYQYPNSSNVRLYVAKTIGAPSSVATTTLQNAQFDASGNYLSSTASGTVPASAIIAISTSGIVSSVGGSYTGVYAPTANNLYKAPTNGAYCSFLNQYGVWGDPNASASFNSTYAFNIQVAGSYTIIAAVDNSAIISIDGSPVLTINGPNGFQATSTVAVTLSAATHNVSWVAANSGGAAAFGLTIQDAFGNLIFSTPNPPNLTYVNAGTEVVMPFGGSYFSGVTQVVLPPGAANTAGIYVGATINFTSKYVYQSTVASSYTPAPTAGVGVSASSNTSIYGWAGAGLGAATGTPLAGYGTDANYLASGAVPATTGGGGLDALLNEPGSPVNFENTGVVVDGQSYAGGWS